MGDKPGALTVDYGVAYFTLESREETAAILDSIRQHAPFEGEFTRGLYFKGNELNLSVCFADSSPNRGASGETVHFGGDCQSLPY